MSVSRAVAAAVLLGVPAVVMGWSAAIADDVPLPRPRPAISADPQSFAEANNGLFNTGDLTTALSECRLRLNAIAVAEALPRLIGPSECGGTDMVRLKAVIMADRSQIEINPPPELRCAMAESVATWLREEVAPKFAEVPLRAVENYDSYECRGRNRVLGARTSEHGKGNALDVRAFKLANGKVFDPTDIKADHELRATLKDGACRRFTTVLGPGSDGYHESHIHLDIAERRNGYRLCQWEVRNPPPPEIARADIPLPQPRPFIAGEPGPPGDKNKL